MQEAMKSCICELVFGRWRPGALAGAVLIASNKREDSFPGQGWWFTQMCHVVDADVPDFALKQLRIVHKFRFTCCAPTTSGAKL